MRENLRQDENPRDHFDSQGISSSIIAYNEYISTGLFVENDIARDAGFGVTDC